MATNYIALPDNHTVIYTPFLQFLTLTMQVYVRLSASEHNNIVTQAIKETVYQNSPSNDTKVKTESAERSTKHPETANRPSPPPNTTGVKPQPNRKPTTNRRVYFLQNAAKARNALLSTNAENARNITKTHQKPSEPNPTSTPTKSLSLAHPISPNSLDTIVEQHAQTNEEAHNVSHDAIDPDTQAYSDDDLIDIRDENGTNLLLPTQTPAETASPDHASPPPSSISNPPETHPSHCNPNESDPPYVQTMQTRFLPDPPPPSLPTTTPPSTEPASPPHDPHQRMTTTESLSVMINEDELSLVNRYSLELPDAATPNPIGDTVLEDATYISCQSRFKMTNEQIALAWCLDHENLFCTECKPEYTEEEENAALWKFLRTFTSEARNDEANEPPLTPSIPTSNPAPPLPTPPKQTPSPSRIPTKPQSTSSFTQ